MADDVDQLALALADRRAGQQANLAAATAGHRRYREAVEAVLADLVATGHPFTADDVRQAVPADAEAEAHSPNVLPSVLGTWAARRVIVPCGEYRSRRRPRRASRNRVWIGNHPNE
ncbi:hypothetical protein [Actinokineospora iranica]|uniref:Uncharacterized protein n=1 Tax=Actinokineospora iranica TaxID=1271860 RepID=A0A1G6Y6X6_9PSEU|nr:hypothetical protein [Actinokineospora iranica]SDD86179.1 hypothetical protein SAMN05216174_12062 [Actinokineospora iranica]